MTTEHPITPPPELVQQWMRFNNMEIAPLYLAQALATQAARWGADQELEACINWMRTMGYWGEDGVAISKLRAARRPKPPSVKELALTALVALDACASQSSDTTESVFYIRRALEALPE